MRPPLTANQIEQAQADLVGISANPDGSWPYKKVAAIATMHQACAEYAALKRRWEQGEADGETP